MRQIARVRRCNINSLGRQLHSNDLFSLDLVNAKVPESQQPAMREQILARLRTLPGVTSASESIITPISASGRDGLIHSHLPDAPTGRGAQVLIDRKSVV